MLVDTSRSRIRSRSLRGAEAIAQATPYDPTLVVLWADRLRGLSEFKRWVEENYRLVKVYNRRNDLDRGIYVPETRNLTEVRALLAIPAAVPLHADFAEGPLLVSALVDRTEIRPGEGASVTLEWESTRPLRADFHVADGAARAATDRPGISSRSRCRAGATGTTDWEVGRWLFQSTFVRTDDRCRRRVRGRGLGLRLAGSTEGETAGRPGRDRGRAADRPLTASANQETHQQVERARLAYRADVLQPE